MRMIIIPALLLASPSLAETVYRLSDAERNAVQAQAAVGPEHDPVLTAEGRLPIGGGSVLDRPLYPEFYAPQGGKGGINYNDGKPHGEMGVFAGTGGAGGVYGTIAGKLSDNVWGSFSFMNSQGPSYGRYGGYNRGYGGGLTGFSFSGRWSPGN
ncbi:MAG: hypothetical protein WCO82_06185 [Sphingomonadales bacterium]|jgi:hypothetical protein